MSAGGGDGTLIISRVVGSLRHRVGLCGADRRGKQPTDDEQFGHGFTIAGAALVYLLGQREKFDLLDFSQHVLNVQVRTTDLGRPAGEGGGDWLWVGRTHH